MGRQQDWPTTSAPRPRGLNWIPCACVGVVYAVSFFVPALAIRGLGGTTGVATADGMPVSAGPAVVYGGQVLGFAPLPRVGAAKFVLDEDAFLPLRYRLLAWVPNLILVAGVAMLATYRTTGTRLLGWLAFGSGIGSLAVWDFGLGGDWRPAVGYCLWLASMLMLPAYVWACHRLARAD